MGVSLIARQASIVGKRIGFHRWSPTTSKTLEGSIAFTVSIAGCAWLLRLLGVAETFSVRFFDIDMGIARSADCGHIDGTLRFRGCALVRSRGALGPK